MASDEPLEKRTVHEAILNADVETLTIKVKGESMEPVLHDGDSVRAVKGIYLPGEILAFLTGDHITIHRMVGWWFTEGRWVYLTKGDNQKGMDGFVSPDRVLGKVKSWIHDGRSRSEGLVQRVFRLIKSLGEYVAARIAR